MIVTSASVVLTTDGGAAPRLAPPAMSAETIQARLTSAVTMRDDTTSGRGITENIPPEACMDQPFSLVKLV